MLNGGYREENNGIEGELTNNECNIVSQNPY